MAFQPKNTIRQGTVPNVFPTARLKPNTRHCESRIAMSAENEISRRTLLVKLGLLLNGMVGIALAVPIVRYLLSPVTRGRKNDYESWLPLGTLQLFPAGQTRLATYRNPVVSSWDGETGDIPCWVRNVDNQTFQVFAINCAHLGCPVRWFPQSSLFLCPCHGGAYYQDGSRASGPPERGLFQYDYKVEKGKLFIKAGEMPTPGRALKTQDKGKHGETACG
jgi:menaquinol-cytochrome c reductase iron-sulfur subunit